MKAILAFAMAISLLLVTLSLTAEDSPAPAATTQPTTRPVTPEMSADAVIKQLLMSRSKEAVLPETTTAPASQPATIAPRTTVKPLPMPPGAMIVNRTGRLLKDDATGWWQLHFESEKDVLYEAPIRVLPNRLLEAMESIMDSSGKARILFKVTGEVTQYRDRRHLLIRRMVVKRELGAL